MTLFFFNFESSSHFVGYPLVYQLHCSKFALVSHCILFFLRVSYTRTNFFVVRHIILCVVRCPGVRCWGWGYPYKINIIRYSTEQFILCD